MNKKLLRAFKRSKMSIYRLSKKSGIAESTIRNWRNNGTDLGLSKAEKIAKAIGLKGQWVEYS